MRLASVVVTRSVTWCGLPKAGSCTRRTCSATVTYSGDSHRSLRIVQDDLMLVPRAGLGGGAVAYGGEHGRVMFSARREAAGDWPRRVRSSCLRNGMPRGLLRESSRSTRRLFICTMVMMRLGTFWPVG